MNRESIIWCAGLFEGEGSITESKLPSGKIYPRIKVKMCDKDSVQKFADTFDIPCLNVTKDKSWQTHWKDAWYCSVTGKKAYAILVALFPWLGNRRQARAKDVISKWIQTTGGICGI